MGNATGNATCNTGVNASVSAAEKRAQQEEQEEEGEEPPPAVIVHPEQEDADIIPCQDLMRLIKHASQCAAVRKRQDIMDREEYYNFMRMTNAEKHELLRYIIQRQATPSATWLRVFFTGPVGCGKTLVLRHAMDHNGNATTQHRQQHREHQKGGCGSGRNQVQRLSSSLGRPPAPTKTEASVPAS